MTTGIPAPGSPTDVPDSRLQASRLADVAHLPDIAAPITPVPPAWFTTVAASPGFGHLTARIPFALSLDAPQLAAAVADAYQRIGASLDAERRHALRIWNFVPQIHAPLGSGDRYMAFNAGRFAAYSRWFGGAEVFCGSVPAASAVGVEGDTLWIHVLSADNPGTAVENPRQVPSYRYSERYGVRPPCFARATRAGSQLLIAGTASILGEDSLHIGDVGAQARETFANIAALIENARTAKSPGKADSPCRALRDLRVHVLRGEDAALVRGVVGEFAADVHDIEIVRAELCRRELLVEIEGRADL